MFPHSSAGMWISPTFHYQEYPRTGLALCRGLPFRRYSPPLQADDGSGANGAEDGASVGTDLIFRLLAVCIGRIQNASPVHRDCLPDNGCKVSVKLGIAIYRQYLQVY